MATEPLAIVGISCRLPGQSNNIDSLWKLLGDGGDAWSPVPADRFNETAFYHPNADDPNGTTNHRGGHFIDGDIRDFDHSFFHLSPSVAAAMDPQQRILLELAYEALESAGYTRETCAGSRTAVYAAIFGTDYERNLYKDVLDLPVYQSVGTGVAILANRISHIFDLRGPSMTLDTGCSGGLVALHHACQSLRTGESDAALVAAANLQLMPDQYVGMSTQHMVNSNGRSFPFDVRGDGYGRGEGFVVILVKRLSDALRDRDPIRSIILNTGINQDGYTASGITHPNRNAQADLIRETYARIGLRPQDVGYIEAHGTGTVAGDHEELAAISDVFITPDRSLPLYVGSNKGSIGHTESTSGLASVLKAVLVLDREIIPPVGGFAQPKPGLPLNGIRIPTEKLPWPHVEGITPRVSVNSFGYGGANAHVVLERGPKTHEASSTYCPLNGSELLVFSANSRASLISTLESHADWIERHPDARLSDLSYSLCCRRSALPWRFSYVSHGLASLSNGLRQGLHKLSSRSAPSKQEIVFVFTGQGSQWAGMGRELLLDNTSSSVFRDSIRNSRDILRELGAVWDLEAELLREDGKSDINKAELAQPVTTAVQLALVTLLRAQGVRPSVVVGHSSGEIAAAYAAGRLTQRTALLVAFHRGFMAAASKEAGLPSGAMLAVGLSEHEVQPYLDDLSRGKAVVACVNSPGSVTVSGDADAVDEVVDRITARGDGTFCRKLRVDTAYHSHHMRAVANEYRIRLDNPTLAEEYRLLSSDAELTENVTFVSSVTGQVRSSGFGTEYWVNNLASPVRFYDAVQAIVSKHFKSRNSHAIFLEVGPHSALDGPIRQSLAATDVATTGYDYFSTLQRGTDAVSTMLSLAGRLFERGVKIDFNKVLNLTTRSRIAIFRPDLPSYAWDHSTKHWHESRLNREYRMRREPYHDLLGVRMTESTALEPRWRHMVGLNTLPWLADHVIDGLAIYPGAAYVCMAAEAMVQLAREQHQVPLETLIFRNVSFLRALVVPDAPQRLELQLSFKRVSDGPALKFAFSVTALSDGQWHEPCKGFVEGVTANATTESELDGDSSIQQPTLSDGTSLIPESLYAEMAAGGNTYGRAFRGLRSMVMAADGSKSNAVVEIPDIATVMPAQHQAPHVLHPTTFDSMFHVGIPMIRHQHGAGSVMPVHIGELLVSTKTDALSRPGAELNISAEITSNQFRTTYIDMTASADGRPILSATAIESRSLVAQNNGAGEGICYELTWQPDLDFLRERNLPSTPSLANIIASVCFKNANLSAIELGARDGDLALSFLTAVRLYGGTMATYDFADTTSEYFDKARKRLIGHPIKYILVDPVRTFESQGVTPNTYDVVIISNIGALAEPTFLLKGNGVLLLVLTPEAIESWRKTLQEKCPTLYVQTSFFDDAEGRLIVVVRQVNAQSDNLPSNVHVLTHSILGATPFWVNKLKTGLGMKGIEIHHESLSDELTQSEADGTSCIVIVDDLPQSILDDRLCFEASIELLRERNQILWLSLDDPPSMHQITGVARTAHAENDTLRLTTAHLAIEVLESNELAEMVARWLKHVDNPDGAPNHEREYKVNKDGTVLIPRLHHSDQLNHAITTSGNLLHEEVQTTRYIDAPQPIALDVDESPGHAGKVVFKNSAKPDLANDAIEIETRAFVLSKSDDSTASHLGEYAGIVRRIGKSVKGYSVGDAVLAISIDGTVGHSRPHIPYLHATHQPSGLAPAVAVATFLPALAASHALHSLVHLPKEGGLVLVHGILSGVGRATVAVAQSLGARVIAIATDAQEALEITQQLGLGVDDIIISRPSLYRPQYDDALKIDAIFEADQEKPVASIAWAHLKPFGHVVFFHSSYSVATLPKLPRNATMHTSHIADFLYAYPDHAANLVTQASQVIEQIPVHGFDFATYDVCQVGEAHRLLQLGVHDRVVLQASTGSLVQVTAPLRIQDRWTNTDATYVVAGGMGDLGRRLLLLMARRGAGHLVTLSRRTIQPDDHRLFQEQLELIRPGCRLLCLVCDITSERSVKDAAAAITSSGFPTVRGVIQSAVLLQDRTLENMTYDNFHSVTLAKVQGTIVLGEVFTSPYLDFFLMLSSAVNVTGASGQANYNAGNAVQDALAHSGRVGFTSLNVGWIEDAVNTSNNKTILQGLWRTGLRPIHPEQLSRYFDYILGSASGRSSLRQAIIGFDSESLSHTSASNSNVRSALFCHVRGSLTTNRTSPPTGGVQSFKDIAESSSSEAIVDFISNSIIDHLATLISVDAAHVSESHGSILELGLDSLVAIELRNWITREFEAPLQSSEIMTDQSIQDLAQKVVSRSRLILSDENTEVSHDTTQSDVSFTDDSSTSSLLLPKTASLRHGHVAAKLPPLPVPPLEEIIQLFEESRQAIDDAEDRTETSRAVRSFIEGPGPSLRQRLQSTKIEDFTGAYERQVYLERREPLPETGPFTFTHPLDAPIHSQAQRAAILTVAAMDFAQRLSKNELPPDTLHGQPLSTEGREWLFYATRRPGLGVDYMKRHTPNPTVAILRRGHVFCLTASAGDQPVHLPAVYAAYNEILSASNELITPVCTLTADNRDSWALLRQELERSPENAAALSCIDEAAFVVCLDDESPTGPGERYTQFLLNGKDRPFANRWLDKTLQFIVTANGLSAETYEHTKLDGLDARMLHAYISRALLESADNSKSIPSPSHPSKCTVQEYVWKRSATVTQRIGRVMDRCRTYGPLDYQVIEVPDLGFSTLRSSRSPPNATAHLTVLLAMYYVDGEIRPAWEKVSLGTFAGGRVEWVQTVSLAARAFVESAATNPTSRTTCRALLNKATTAHSRTLAAASRGRAAVGPLYALRGVAQEPLPALFSTRAWEATRRGGPGQDLKIGFMRFSGDDGDGSEHDSGSDLAEAGFLVSGERGAYVHCNVRERSVRFAVSGKPAYVAKVCDGLRRAAGVVLGLLEDHEQPPAHA